MGTKQAKKIRKELRKLGAVDLINDITEKAEAELKANIDAKLKSRMKPKPFWLPYFMHTWLVKQLIIVGKDEQVNNKN